MAKSALNAQSLAQMAVRAEYSPGNLATISGRKPWELRREIQRCFGCSPRAWLDRERLQRVESLLISGRLWVKEATAAVCFKHCSSFCRWFKAHTHLRPSQYPGPVPLQKEEAQQSEDWSI